MPILNDLQKYIQTVLFTGLLIYEHSATLVFVTQTRQLPIRTLQKEWAETRIWTPTKCLPFGTPTAVRYSLRDSVCYYKFLGKSITAVQFNFSMLVKISKKFRSPSTNKSMISLKSCLDIPVLILNQTLNAKECRIWNLTWQSLSADA